MSATRKQRALIELSIVGDRAAFDALYRLWYARWHQFALRHTDNADIAHDALQEAALAMVRNVARLRGPETFVAWSFVIHRRCCADALRRRIRHRKYEVSDSRDYHQPPAEPSDPRLTDLAEVIDGLDADHQNVLTLFYGYGLTVTELAVVYEVPVGTIKSRLFQIREQIRSRVSQLQKDDV